MLLLPEQRQRGGQHQQQRQQTPLLQLSSSISRRQNLKPSHLITQLLPPANVRVWRSYQAFTDWSNSSMPTSLDSNENFRSKSFSSSYSSWHIQYCTDCLLHSKCKWALSEARSSLSLLFLLGCCNHKTQSDTSTSSLLFFLVQKYYILNHSSRISFVLHFCKYCAHREHQQQQQQQQIDTSEMIYCCSLPASLISTSAWSIFLQNCFFWRLCGYSVYACVILGLRKNYSVPFLDCGFLFAVLWVCVQIDRCALSLFFLSEVTAPFSSQLELAVLNNHTTRWELLDFGVTVSVVMTFEL